MTPARPVDAEADDENPSVMSCDASIFPNRRPDYSHDVPLAPPPRCPICNDAGYLRRDVPPRHPSFGKLFPCDCKVREQNERLAHELRNLSNLDAFPDQTFEAFDDSIAGVEGAFTTALDYAANPDGWLFLHGPVRHGQDSPRRRHRQ